MEKDGEGVGWMYRLEYAGQLREKKREGVGWMCRPEYIGQVEREEKRRSRMDVYSGVYRIG